MKRQRNIQIENREGETDRERQKIKATRYESKTSRSFMTAAYCAKTTKRLFKNDFFLSFSFPSLDAKSAVNIEIKKIFMTVFFHDLIIIL